VVVAYAAEPCGIVTNRGVRSLGLETLSFPRLAASLRPRTLARSLWRFENAPTVLAARSFHRVAVDLISLRLDP